MATSRNKRKAEPPSQPRPGRTINVVLTVLLFLLAWSWFHFHVKRHVAGWAFGGVTTVAAVAFAWMIWQSFAGDELKTLPQRWLSWRHTRTAVIALLVLVALAHVFTGSLHVDVDPDRLGAGKKLVAELTRTGAAARTLHLDAKNNQAALTFPVWGGPVEVRVVTKAPRGYTDQVVKAGRFVQTLTLPDAEHEKKYNLVRLAPGMFLFSLRGSAPDPDYKLDVFVNGNRVQRLDALGFQTIYLGAAADDLKVAIEGVHGNDRHKAELERFLVALDAGMPKPARDAMVADWLAGPRTLDTPELQPGDSVRVVLTGHGLTSFDQTLRPMPRGDLQTVFLKGAATP